MTKTMQELCRFCSSNEIKRVDYNNDLDVDETQCSKCLCRLKVKVKNPDDKCVICHRGKNDREDKAITVYRVCHHWICRECSMRFKNGCYICGRQKTDIVCGWDISVSDELFPYVQTLYVILRKKISTLMNIDSNDKLKLHFEILMLINEYYKFMKLLCQFGDKELTPSPPIDKVWQIHILDTHNYLTFCSKLFGKIIHYSQLNKTKEHQFTLECYVKKYGKHPPTKYWPNNGNIKYSTKNINPTYNEDSSGEFPIHVMCRSGRKFSVMVDGNTTIRSLKYKIYLLEDIKIDVQRIIYCGVNLEDDKKIASYNIQKLATLHLVLRLKGC